MSTRSSPLSSPSPPPPPQTKPTDPFRSLSPLSSVSDISQSGVLPPSSPPLADVFIDQEVDEEIEEDGRDTRSQTSETVPLGSESDLTEEETDEDEGEEVVVVDGPPVGIRPSVVPESTEEDGDMEVDDEPTPHHTRPKRIVSATTSASPTRTRSTSGLITRQASKSPSLTPPPPSEKTRLRALPRLSASPGVKRKRSSPPVPPGEVVKAQSPLEAASTGFGGDLLPAQNANHLELNGQDVGLTDEVTAESYEDKDISVDDPEADQAFKEAMDSFDNEHEEPDIVNGDPVERVVDDDEEMREDVGGEQQDDPLDVEEAVGDAVGPLMGLEQEEEVTDSADQAQEGVMPTKMEENGAVEETDTAAPADAPDEAIIEQEEPAPSPKATLHPPAPHSHSSHAPPPTQAAMRALLALEVKFAALRDGLYIERMEEAAEEEEMILNGSHPALKQLHKTLSHRRERLHELASRRHAQAVQQLKVVRQAEQDAVWSWWTDERDRTHWEEFEQTWSKRRRLAREKNEIESVRWTKPVPIAGDPRFGKSFDWAAGPSPARLTVDEGNHDLALIEHRQQISRHASPAVFPPLSSYPIPQHPGQYPSYPPVGHNQTYAEAVSEPRPRQSSSSHYHSRQTQPQQPPPYTGTGLMDHYAYPRNATAIGPSTSSSSLGLSQPSSQPRREGRTVPTASTMFGPGPGSGTTPNHGHNSSIANAQFPTLTSAVPVPSAQNGIGKEVKQESLDYLNRDKTGTPATATAAPTPTGYGNIGPWGNRSVPMGFGLGFGLGGGGSGSSTAGFGTLGSTQSQGNTAGTGNGLGQGRKEGSLVNGGGTSNGYQPPWATQSSTTIGKYGQADRLAETASSTSTPAQTPTPTPTGRPPTPSQAQQQRPNPSPNPSATNQFSRVSANSSGNGSTGGITTLNGVLADKEREKEREKEKEKEKEKERERDWSRPKYPGLAEYLDATAALAAAAADGHGRANTAGGVTGTGAAQGAQTGTAAAGTVGGGGGGGVGAVSGTGYGGLGRLGIMGSSTNGVLSPPRISRSPFGPPPPQATTTSAPAQTASRT